MNLYGSRDGLGNLYFSLGLAGYALIGGLFISYKLIKQKTTELKWAFLAIAVGVSFFGVGTLLWFYMDLKQYSDILFPSFADYFYILQFPLTSFGIFCLFNNGKKSLENNANLASLFWFLITLVSVIYAKIFLGSYFNLANFLMFYFPLETFSILILLTYVFTRGKKLEGGYKILVLSYVTWLTADLFFFYEYMSGVYFSAGYSDLLYLIGSYLSFLSLVTIAQTRGAYLAATGDGVTYFKSITYKIPVSLNLKSNK